MPKSLTTTNFNHKIDLTTTCLKIFVEIQTDQKKHGVTQRILTHSGNIVMFQIAIKLIRFSSEFHFLYSCCCHSGVWFAFE